MTRSKSTIPVDVLNPGQVFACYGLIELAELLCGEVRAGFVGDRFVIEAKGEVEPVEAAIDFIAGSKTYALFPKGITAEAQPWKWSWKKLDVEELSVDEYASRAPGAPAKLVARLKNGKRHIDVDHWAEEDRTGRDNVKFWAGAGGMPGVVMLESAIELVRAERAQAYADPLNFQRPQSSSFRFDWRSGYIPMDIGWSLNNHQKAKTGGYPLVDVLAAIGLSSARPRFVKKLLYRYGVLQGAGHRPLFLRAALGGELAGFSRREFEIELGWPGKEGQARAIVGVTEVKSMKERAQ
ncbi:MAG TPA: type I-U CRISPR-associated protein Cas8c [Chiayiivirga sp.]|nr:type I-U CRISPR-associated protein Cas8c [Chiayiivirga sp.]